MDFSYGAFCRKFGYDKIKESPKFSYRELCKKFGYDPLREPDPTPYHGHEDDSHENPFSRLSFEEKDFFTNYYLHHRYYEELCEKLGFDPMETPDADPFLGNGDEAHGDPLSPLSFEEQEFLLEYYLHYKKSD